MAIRNVLVHLDSSRACKTRVSAAIDIASRFSGSLIGHYPRPQMSTVVFADAGAATAAYQQLMDEIQDEAEKVELEFRDTMQSTELPMSWESDDSRAHHGLIETARYCDLVVIGQHDPDDPRCTSDGMAAQAAIAAGTPVLVIPPAGVTEGFGKTPLIAWNGSREAARAVHDSLPLLAGAERTHAVAVDAPAEVLGRLMKALSAHGVSIFRHARNSDGEAVEQVLLNTIEELQCDLVVLGAYGHSRMREFILGGVTRTLLTEASVPLLISH